MTTSTEQQARSPLGGAIDVVPVAAEDRVRGTVAATVGVAGEPWLVELSGWVLGTTVPAVALELVCDGVVVCRLRPTLERPDVAGLHPGVAGAERCGFRASFSSLALPPDFELELRAVLEAGSASERQRARIAGLRGVRPALAAAASVGPAPLMITTLDHSASKLLARLLAADPAVAAYRAGEVESRVGSYWAAFLRGLSEPESYARALAPGDSQSDPGWWLAPPSPSVDALAAGAAPVWSATDAITRDRPLYDALGRDTVAGLAAFARGRIEHVYGWIANDQGNPHAAFVAEQYGPGQAPSLVGELFSDARELVLVRDFRDAVCSRLSREGGDFEQVLECERDRVTALIGDWRQRRQKAHLVRYEDLVLDPERTVTALLAYLGLDGAGGELAAALGEQIAAQSPERSVGRFRRELRADHRQACELALAGALEQFGYEPGDGDRSG